MRRPAITVGPDATVVEAVRLLRRQHLKRLPVTDPGGRLVGIVSRSDLLEGLLRPDEELRQELLEEIIFGRFGLAPDRFTVTVSDGVVGLSGRCPHRDLIPALVRAVVAVEGVVRVENGLAYAPDDTATLGPGARPSDPDSLWMDLE